MTPDTPTLLFNAIFSYVAEIEEAEGTNRADEGKFLEVALQRRRELQERCLRELKERFGIQISDDER